MSSVAAAHRAAVDGDGTLGSRVRHDMRILLREGPVRFNAHTEAGGFLHRTGTHDVVVACWSGSTKALDAVTRSQSFWTDGHTHRPLAESRAIMGLQRQAFPWR